MTSNNQLPRCDDCGKHCDVFEVIFPDGSKKLLCADDYAIAKAQLREAVLAALALFCGDKTPNPNEANHLPFEEYGSVLAANHLFAVLVSGHGNAIVLDQAEWSLELGHAYRLNLTHGGKRLKELLPIDPVKIRNRYGDTAGDVAAGWAERDKEMGLVRDKGRETR